MLEKKGDHSYINYIIYLVSAMANHIGGKSIELTFLRLLIMTLYVYVPHNTIRLNGSRGMRPDSRIESDTSLASH